MGMVDSKPQSMGKNDSRIGLGVLSGKPPLPPRLEKLFPRREKEMRVPVSPLLFGLDGRAVFPRALVVCCLDHLVPSLPLNGEHPQSVSTDRDGKVTPSSDSASVYRLASALSIRAPPSASPSARHWARASS